jgi:hypothetical protein
MENDALRFRVLNSCNAQRRGIHRGLFGAIDNENVRCPLFRDQFKDDLHYDV